MAIFFRGDGPGTHWAAIDACGCGFTAKTPYIGHSADRAMHHIASTKVGAKSSVVSSYISLTASENVARNYALAGPSGIATNLNPGFIYEIEIADNPKDSKFARLFDPVKVIADFLPAPPAALPYQHKDYPGVMLGVVLPRLWSSFSKTGFMGPPGSSPIPWSSVTLPVRCMIHALRDAEILALDYIPKASVIARHAVY